MTNSDKRTYAIIAVVATTLLCALPGLALLCMGVLASLGVAIPDTGMAGAERTTVVVAVILLACTGIVGILVPILIAIFTLRRPPAPKEPPKPVDLNEPIPPPS